MYLKLLVLLSSFPWISHQNIIGSSLSSFLRFFSLPFGRGGKWTQISSQLFFALYTMVQNQSVGPLSTPVLFTLPLSSDYTSPCSVLRSIWYQLKGTLSDAMSGFPEFQTCDKLESCKTRSGMVTLSLECEGFLLAGVVINFHLSILYTSRCFTN